MVAGVPPVSIDSVLTSLREGMPATCQYVCMSSFLVFFFSFLFFFFRLSFSFPCLNWSSLRRPAKSIAKVVHCCIRQTSSGTWVSSKGNLFTSCQKVIVKPESSLQAGPSSACQTNIAGLWCCYGRRLAPVMYSILCCTFC